MAKKPLILVIGDLMIDCYIYGRVTKISPEAPVPVFESHSQKEVAGGAANVATNLVALGADVILAGYGDQKLKNLLPLGTDLSFVDRPPLLNNIKLRYVDSTYQQQMIRIDNEHLSLQDLLPLDVNGILEQLSNKVLALDAIIFSDYNKKTLSCENVQPLIDEADEHGIITVADTRRVKDPWIFAGIDYLTPNLREFQAIEETGFRPEKGILRTESEHGMKYCVIDNTSTRDGTTPTEHKRISVEYGIPAIFNEVTDVTGAGDTVTAAFTYFLCKGLSDRQAFMLSNVAAGLVCKKHGTATVTLGEIGDYAKKEDRYQDVWNHYALQDPDVCVNS